ncbi:DUF368 domain-containing protein [Catenovulum sediminis]|uniref:DUF368 domain-containing protein n=1 Tax=Catenovulum sediminis TaxID=1740262 RepID=A0ABV1RGC4_9ALTE
MSQNKKRSRTEYALLTAKGMAMGAADVVPGVSGGTIAFITGIYDELLSSLKKIGPESVTILLTKGISEFWSHINGWFLLSVFGGILLSLKTFAALITIALSTEPLLVWGFFSGLILASVYLLVKSATAWRWFEWLGLALGVAVVVGVSIAKPAQLPGDWWVLFFGGFVAICAMILPGISGSFILLLVGLYPVFLAAINDMNLIALASFGAGCICGLLIFSRFLSWLLEKYHSTTIAVLIGFLIGSLNVTWPWKHTLQTYTNRHGEEVPLIQENVLPATYTTVNQEPNQLVFVLAAMAIGLALVVGLEYVASKYSENEQ